ncbi:Rhomboid family protein [Fulvivirga imtechensis AK7]|uniref:Rhomboid family protein n=1 Tax=Fulvivirga imtechensis AK7 TaxID=1237149 RepID=L8JKU8_9BACT|nr:rhomboid family intramembrane serine protease [Fulvivirga imtechensis]ELR68129.1 Rhomboid family protein [Fulvivirga imtechensis AK7]
MFRLTPVVKNLLIINIVVFILQYTLSGMDFTGLISLWIIESDNFKPYQYFTYMFAHGGFGHILFNMLGLVFLGPLLEQFWGSKRFLIFYLVTGIGAGVLYSGIEYWRTSELEKDVTSYILEPTPDNFSMFVDEHSRYFRSAVYDFANEFSKNPDDPYYISESKAVVKSTYQNLLNGSSMLGASGAIYGILMAFGLLFPNTQLMLLIPPVPIKAKYLVLILGGIALYSGLNQDSGDNVAHFAHLGGMIFAFIMIKIWQKDRNKFY